MSKGFRICIVLLACGWLASCTGLATPGDAWSRPGCDRNGDYEQRKAC